MTMIAIDWMLPFKVMRANKIASCDSLNCKSKDDPLLMHKLVMLILLVV